MKDLFMSLWRYRNFVLTSIRNEYRGRFARSKLGLLWMVVHPLAQTLIFTIVLAEVLAAKLPGTTGKYSYPVYLMSGMLFWTLFSETLTRFLTVFIDNGSLIKKIAFPRICLVAIAGGVSLINNLLLLAAMVLVFAAMGVTPSVHVLWLPLLMLLTLMLASALGLILGIVNVFMRDIGQFVPVVLQALFWLTPIVYSLETLSPKLQALFAYNPLFPLARSYQNVVVFSRPPDWMHLLTVVVGAMLLLVVALVMFRRASPEMVDVL